MACLLQLQAGLVDLDIADAEAVKGAALAAVCRALRPCLAGQPILLDFALHACTLEGLCAAALRERHDGVRAALAALVACIVGGCSALEPASVCRSPTPTPPSISSSSSSSPPPTHTCASYRTRCSPLLMTDPRRHCGHICPALY